MIRVTQAEFIRDTRALYQRARAERESIAVVDEWGEVRMQVDLGTGEPEADPEDAGGEVYWAVCIGVVALGEWARRQSAKHAARAFVATQPGYECACCGGSGIRPASGNYAVACACGAEYPVPRFVDAIMAAMRKADDE